MNIYNILLDSVNMPPDILVSSWTKPLQLCFKKQLANLYKQVKDASIEQMANLIDTPGEWNQSRLRLKKVLYPTEIMLTLLNYFSEGAFTVRMFEDDYEDFENRKLYNALHVLMKLELITVEILEHTTPKPCQVFIPPFSPEDKDVMYNVENYPPYIADKLRAESKKEALKIEKTIKYVGKDNKVIPPEDVQIRNIPCPPHGVAGCRECLDEMLKLSRK